MASSLYDIMSTNEAFARLDQATERLAAAVREEMVLEDNRALEKSAAVRRLMATTNPETQKLHSASSAEKVVESDAEYVAYRRRQYDAVVEVQRAHGAYAAAKLRATLCVGLATERGQ